VFVGTSVDGFIARQNGSYDFLPEGGGEPHGYEQAGGNIGFSRSRDGALGMREFEKALRTNGNACVSA